MFYFHCLVIRPAVCMFVWHIYTHTTFEFIFIVTSILCIMYYLLSLLKIKGILYIILFVQEPSVAGSYLALHNSHILNLLFPWKQQIPHLLCTNWAIREDPLMCKAMHRICVINWTWRLRLIIASQWWACSWMKSPTHFKPIDYTHDLLWFGISWYHIYSKTCNIRCTKPKN